MLETCPKCHCPRIEKAEFCFCTYRFGDTEEKKDLDQSVYDLFGGAFRKGATDGKTHGRGV